MMIVALEMRQDTLSMKKPGYEKCPAFLFLACGGFGFLLPKARCGVQKPPHAELNVMLAWREMMP